VSDALATGVIVEIPLSNLYRLHWSVNPTDARRVEAIKNAPPESIPPVEGYRNAPPAFKGSYSKLLPKAKLNRKYPKVYIGDGTHRAVAAMLRAEEMHERDPKIRVVLHENVEVVTADEIFRGAERLR